MKEIKKDKSFVRYIFIGLCTTLVNLSSYFFFYTHLECSALVSSVYGWALAVIFAYISNRYYVFESKEKNVVEEFLKFSSCRIISGFFEVFFMFVTVDVWNLRFFLSKCSCIVFVTLMNYFASKFMIFGRNIK